MLLALLMLVAGRLGGPLGGPTLWFETDRAMGGGTLRPSRPADWGGVTTVSGGPGGGADARPIPPMGGGGGVEGMWGAGDELEDRGGPFGGGGVDFLASVFSAPAFLLIHRLSSGSYTKLLCSPSLALIGLFAGSGLSFLLPPPNQLVKPQPFLVAFSAACFAIKVLVTWLPENSDLECRLTLLFGYPPDHLLILPVLLRLGLSRGFQSRNVVFVVIHHPLLGLC